MCEMTKNLLMMSSHTCSLALVTDWTVLTKTKAKTQTQKSKRKTKAKTNQRNKNICNLIWNTQAENKTETLIKPDIFLELLQMNLDEEKQNKISVFFVKVHVSTCT